MSKYETRLANLERKNSKTLETHGEFSKTELEALRIASYEFSNRIGQLDQNCNYPKAYDVIYDSMISDGFDPVWTDALRQIYKDYFNHT